MKSGHIVVFGEEQELLELKERLSKLLPSDEIKIEVSPDNQRLDHRIYLVKHEDRYIQSWVLELVLCQPRSSHFEKLKTIFGEATDKLEKDLGQLLRLYLKS